ncbi:G-protein coupled receptor GRL101-like [Lytechinus pictus]|uniref:G-protein coupled receptor GRL101-like n=1 Tax=Lytechinus pictus TaxID=7653 RepID=UPI0030B9C6BA
MNGCDTFPCQAGYHKCNNNHYCIPPHLLCNFVDDCGDNSDEEKCYHPECYKLEFKCSNRQCINAGFMCDGNPDCFDGSDEARCDEDHYVLCDNGKKIYEHEWCDRNVDCPDNEADEQNCDCTADEYKCPNGKCLRPSVRCNGVCDCMSCEDEKECTDEDMCNYETNGILCAIKNNKPAPCVRQEYICDGYFDCPRNMDEYNCQIPGKVSGSCDPEGINPHMMCDDKDGLDDPRCVPSKVLCDPYRRPNCMYGFDEQTCNVTRPCDPELEFECPYGRCIDLSSRCDAHLDCFDFSDEANCESFECPPGTWKCQSGQCLPEILKCDYTPSCFYVNGTIDSSDEDHCDYKFLSCKEGEFRCSNDQCIPQEDVCFLDTTGYKGCKDESHLFDCGNWNCQDNEFKCLNSYCINMSDVCNGPIDCRRSWIDEVFCPYSCGPANLCTCNQTRMSCINLGFESFHNFHVDDDIHDINLSGNRIKISNEVLVNIPGLLRLDLSNNSMNDIDNDTFSGLANLTYLNLENNNITVIRKENFKGLEGLQSLLLRGNNINMIEPHAFEGLKNITTLDLSHQNLTEIPNAAFVGLYKLRFLDLSANQIIVVPDGAFFGLYQLRKLDISGNAIEVVSRRTFNMRLLDELITDEYRFCCMARHVSKCLPLPDEFSSCEDLMSNPILRMCIWIIGMIALIGNLFVILWRVNSKRDNKVHSFLITNLAVGDMFMGIYLLIIACVDAYYRGDYIVHDKLWRSSGLCKFAGFLSTFSSELSVFSLTIITLHRLSSIVFPFRIKDMEFTRAVWVMGVSWGLVAFLAALPLCGVAYFGNFYGRSGVCLALHITPDRPSGWEYAVFIFLGLNFVSFMTIMVSYGVMFNVARKTQKAAMRSLKSKGSDSMARRMSVIVFTDFCCWVPIILLGVASLSGAYVPASVYAWVAVFVMPVNSAVNPILYTLGSAITVRRAIQRFSINPSTTVTSEYKTVMNNSSDRKQGGYKGRPLRTMSTNANEYCKPAPTATTTTTTAKPKPQPCKEETIKMIDLGNRQHVTVDDGENKALTSTCNNNERTPNNV